MQQSLRRHSVQRVRVPAGRDSAPRSRFTSPTHVRASFVGIQHCFHWPQKLIFRMAPSHEGSLKRALMPVLECFLSRPSAYTRLPPTEGSSIRQSRLHIYSLDPPTLQDSPAPRLAHTSKSPFCNSSLLPQSRICAARPKVVVREDNRRPPNRCTAELRSLGQIARKIWQRRKAPSVKKMSQLQRAETL